jgi:hypothetical protein
MGLRQVQRIVAVFDAHPEWTSTQIAAAVGGRCLPSCVRETLRRRGRTLKRSRPARRLYEWERQALANGYAGREKVEALAAELNVHPSTVGRAAEWAGYTLRSEIRGLP